MSEGLKHLGLCSTCRHAPTCTYPRDPKRPVFNCEEFEIEVGEPVKLSGGDVLSSGVSPRPGPCEDDFARKVGAAEGPDDAARYKGLCGNCDNRKSCTFPKPEGGVWHCEEYQ